MAHDVFISYKSDDKIIAERIYDGLMSRGIRCWISSRDIPPGYGHQSEIVRAIKGCRLMVVIFSSAAQNSMEIPKELAIASKEKKLIVPIRVEDIEPNDTFEYALANSQYLDICAVLAQGLDGYLDLIYSAVSNHLRKHEREPESSESLHRPPKNHSLPTASFDEDVPKKEITDEPAALIRDQAALNKIKNPEIRSKISACIEGGIGEFKPDNCRLVLSGPGAGAWNLNGRKYGVYLWQVDRFDSDIALYRECGLEEIKEAYEGKCVSAKITSGVAFDNFMRLVDSLKQGRAPN